MYYPRFFEELAGASWRSAGSKPKRECAVGLSNARMLQMAAIARVNLGLHEGMSSYVTLAQAGP